MADGARGGHGGDAGVRGDGGQGDASAGAAFAVCRFGHSRIVMVFVSVIIRRMVSGGGFLVAVRQYFLILGGGGGALLVIHDAALAVLVVGAQAHALVERALVVARRVAVGCGGGLVGRVLAGDLRFFRGLGLALVV